jgi:hypothetical protein
MNMTIQLMNQIQLAEREIAKTNAYIADPRFTPDASYSLRELGARLLRSSAGKGLELADRLDPEYQYA